VFVLKKSTRFSENTRYYLSYSKKQAKILGGFEIFRPIVKEREKKRKQVERRREGRERAKRVEGERRGEGASEASGTELK
jgi:hypothetical protein